MYIYLYICLIFNGNIPNYSMSNGSIMGNWETKTSVASTKAGQCHAFGPPCFSASLPTGPPNGLPFVDLEVINILLGS